MAMNRFMGDSRIRNVYRGLARRQRGRGRGRAQANTAYGNMRYSMARRRSQSKYGGLTPARQTPGTDRARHKQSLNAARGKMNSPKVGKLRSAGKSLQSAYRNRSTEQGGMNRAAARLNSFQPQKKAPQKPQQEQSSVQAAYSSMAPRRG